MRRLSIRKLLAVALFLAVVLCLSTYLILRRRHMSITYEGWASRLDSHPRIYFAKDGLEDIRRKCSEGVFKDLLDELRAYADAAAGYLSTNGWANSRKLQMYAFLYAVTGDEKYAQYAEVYIKWFTSRVDSLDSFELGMGIEAVAEGLDWCYGYLKPEKLSEYGKGLQRVETLRLQQPRLHQEPQGALRRYSSEGRRRVLSQGGGVSKLLADPIEGASHTGYEPRRGRLWRVARGGKL